MSIFDHGGKEEFKFELLTLQDGIYKHSQFITDYVENASIDIDFERDIIAGAKFNIKHLTKIDYLKQFQ